MKANHESAITCKVIVIGQSGVGKTSITTNYVKNTYHRDCLPTQGASFSSKVQIFENEDRVIKFDVNLNCHPIDMGHSWPGEISQFS